MGRGDARAWAWHVDVAWGSPASAMGGLGTTVSVPKWEASYFIAVGLILDHDQLFAGPFFYIYTRQQPTPNVTR